MHDQPSPNFAKGADDGVGPAVHGSLGIANGDARPPPASTSPIAALGSGSQLAKNLLDTRIWIPASPIIMSI